MAWIPCCAGSPRERRSQSGSPEGRSSRWSAVWRGTWSTGSSGTAQQLAVAVVAFTLTGYAFAAAQGAAGESRVRDLGVPTESQVGAWLVLLAAALLCLAVLFTAAPRWFSRAATLAVAAVASLGAVAALARAATVEAEDQLRRRPSGPGDVAGGAARRPALTVTDGGRIAAAIVDCDLLDGRSREEVRRLLGRPYPEGGNRWTWEVGWVNDGIGPGDGQQLILQFDRTGRVKRSTLAYRATDDARAHQPHAMREDPAMRIALVSRQLVTHPHSGLNRATRDLACGLHDLGHAVHVIAELSGGDRRAGLPEGIGVHDVSGGRTPAWAASAHGTLARLHAAGRIDVASVPLWGSPGLFATRDPRFPTVVSCMTSAATIGEVDPAWLQGPGGAEALALERTCVQGARHLHGLTRAALAKAIGDYGGEPLTAGVVARGLRDRTTGLGRGPRSDSGPLDLLFVGRLEPRKGVDVLLEAMRVLVDEGADVRLTLAGPDAELSGGGTYRERFEAASAGEAVGERVRFTGAVSDERLGELYAAADVVCQPSRYESHGIVLIEAMMSGLPIVTTSGGGIPEVVERDGNALLAALSAHSATPMPPSAAAMLAVALDERAAAAERELASWRAYARDLESERDDWRGRTEVVNGRRLFHMTSSRTWRYTQPLRDAARAARARGGGAG